MDIFVNYRSASITACMQISLPGLFIVQTTNGPATSVNHQVRQGGFFI
jgi:hypothetical protein